MLPGEQLVARLSPEIEAVTISPAVGGSRRAVELCDTCGAVPPPVPPCDPRNSRFAGTFATSRAHRFIHAGLRWIGGCKQARRPA